MTTQLKIKASAKKCVYCNGDLKSFHTIKTSILKEEMVTQKIQEKLPYLSNKKCRSCSSIIATDLRTESREELLELYQSLPSSYWNKLQGVSYSSDFFALLESELNPKRLNLRICDVGCGAGSFLNQLGQHWEKIGVEPGWPEEEIASDENSVVFLKGTLENVGFESSSLDVISYMDVIEHLHEPLREFETIKKYLKPGGKVVIYTGNSESLTAKLSGKFWLYLKCFGHISVASKSGLSCALKSSGFTQIKTFKAQHPSSSNFFRWMLYFIGSKILRRGTAPLFKDHMLVIATLEES